MYVFNGVEGFIHEYFTTPNLNDVKPNTPAPTPPPVTTPKPTPVAKTIG